MAKDVELAESISIAMLTVLETLGPTERAVFVLREVFDVPYEEIAAAIDKSSAAVRQIAHRARAHVAARQPRFAVDTREQQQVVDRFLVAVKNGDVQGLLDVLAPEVVLVADGGGIAKAARKPIEGAEMVAHLLGMFAEITSGVELKTETIWLNGAPALRFEGLEPIGTTAISVVVEDGRITRIYAMRNPHKLTGIAAEVAISR